MFKYLFTLFSALVLVGCPEIGDPADPMTQSLGSDYDVRVVCEEPGDSSRAVGTGATFVTLRIRSGDRPVELVRLALLTGTYSGDNMRSSDGTPKLEGYALRSDQGEVVLGPDTPDFEPEPALDLFEIEGVHPLTPNVESEYYLNVLNNGGGIADGEENEFEGTFYLDVRFDEAGTFFRYADTKEPVPVERLFIESGCMYSPERVTFSQLEN